MSVLDIDATQRRKQESGSEITMWDRMQMYNITQYFVCKLFLS
jgi:hypothetical protein